MPSLQIRDFPAALHSKLVKRARLDRRTLAQEATVLLAEALSDPAESALTEKERRRKVLEEIERRGPVLDFSRVTPPEVLIREGRDNR